MPGILRRIRLVPLAALATWLLGCDGNPTDTGSSLSVTMAADRAVVSPATPAPFTITITNHGRQSAQVDAAEGYACPAHYAVRDAQARSIDLPSRACALISLAPSILEPGESMVLHDSWLGDESDGAHGSKTVGAGVYQVSARIMARGELLTSPSIPLTVQP